MEAEERRRRRSRNKKFEQQRRQKREQVLIGINQSWRRHIIECTKIGAVPKLNEINLLPKRDFNPFKEVEENEKETR